MAALDLPIARGCKNLRFESSLPFQFHFWQFYLSIFQKREESLRFSPIVRAFICLPLVPVICFIQLGQFMKSSSSLRCCVRLCFVAHLQFPPLPTLAADGADNGARVVSLFWQCLMPPIQKVQVHLPLREDLLPVTNKRCGHIPCVRNDLAIFAQDGAERGICTWYQPF